MDQKSTDTHHILLIEDDIFVRDLYTRAIQNAGFDLDVAIDGQDGLDKAFAQKYDLILLDIMLPKLNGIQVLTALKTNKKTKDITVFLLSNLGQESIIHEAFNIGAAGYMLKARYVPTQIIDIIQTYFKTGIVPADLKEA